MTDLVLVRHGETVWHAENRYAGLTDVELTPRGLAQAERLAGWAAGAGLEAVWASPLSRARITAETAAAKAGPPLTPVRVDERLRELDFGQGDGLTSAEMKARFPEARAAFEADPAAHPLPGGEDPYQAAARFVAALQDIAAAHPEGRVLVVAHTTAIRLALCRLIGVPLGEYRRLFPRLDNCALTELRLRAGQVAMLQYNSPIGAVR
ncbi:Alpha-ribazole-5'-phosphate phosphatase [[Actinomadura] parvosata subsp. kistnae]|uniref:Histidine phosphatase family protein n=1 Tax=[Actinomadura] parvosata subsp. kistnae TaxID=1909395 RepID=A0A1V0AGI8_9ACTN|nr:histidine phosphatase family protein [Nonomuraea sp. ATCC 55076]AQZ69202.1 histidine phosphatase family protein [Nonomuraea sp. ATCC 55076]SPL92192.1 Alpha-ribazole-5'-phosphate phosphatase [Actinomadura parvosata subsp. kistnae]